MAGASRTPASGRCAGRRVTSLIPRCWLGSPSTALCACAKSMDRTERSPTGGHAAPRFAPKCVLALQGKPDEARELFERLLDLRNDVGLLAEEYDPVAGRQLGNFPQAFSHLALVNTAIVLGEGRSMRHPQVPATSSSRQGTPRP